MRSLLRSLLTTASLVWLYFAAPINAPPGVSGIGVLALGLVLFAVLLGWQIRSVMRSSAPWLRAVEVLSVAAPFLLLLFAMTYFLMARQDSGTFSQPLTRIDALYFTVTVFATVGFGDIVARTDVARTIVTIQMLVDLVVIGLGVRLLLGAVRVGLSRRETTPAEATDGDGRSPLRGDADDPRGAAL